MPGTISESLEFAPTGATLAAAIAELNELGDERRRRGRRRRARERALRAVSARSSADDRLSRRPRMVERSCARAGAAARDGTRQPTDSTCRHSPLENAGGLVHLGSTYLEPLEAAGDPRVTLTSLADARRNARDRVDAVHLQIVAPDSGSLHRPRHRVSELRCVRRRTGRRDRRSPLATHLDVASGLAECGLSAHGDSCSAPARARRSSSGISAAPKRSSPGSSKWTSVRRARLDYVAVQQADEGARDLSAPARALCARGGHQLAHRRPRRRAASAAMLRCATRRRRCDGRDERDVLRA